MSPLNAEASQYFHFIVALSQTNTDHTASNRQSTLQYCAEYSMSHSRNRSLAEVLIAVTLVCFLLGFVAVLCIGNYYRARKAMERQRQKRLARLSGQSGAVAEDYSPRSTYSGASSRSGGGSGGEQRNALLSGIPSAGTQQCKSTSSLVQVIFPLFLLLFFR